MGVMIDLQWIETLQAGNEYSREQGRKSVVSWAQGLRHRDSVWQELCKTNLIPIEEERPKKVFQGDFT
jgi:hypothetical protein